jgi:tetratricopeptide (TPR) repeat protein
MAGAVEADLGHVAEADAHFAAAISRLERSLERASNDPEAILPLVSTWTNRGGVLAKDRRFAEADRAFQQALDWGQKLVRLAPANLEHRALLSAAQIGAGQVQLAQGDAKAAARSFVEAANFFEAALQIDKTDQRASYHQLVTTANIYLAAARRQLGDAPGERAAYKKGIEAARTLHAGRSPA